MKCISCETDINPKWLHAIASNSCPNCGKAIMDEHLKNLLSSLRETMDSLQKYPAQLNDWLLSNFNFIKTDSPNIGNYMPKEMLKELKKIDEDKDFQKRKDAGKFTVKVKTDNGEQEIEAQTIQSEETTNDFFKRASNNLPPTAQGKLSTAERTEYLKKMAQQIKKAGAPALTNQSGGSETISSEMLENADPDAVAEFQSLISGDEISSSLSDQGDDDAIHPAVLAMAKMGKSGAGNSNAADLLKLQQMQERARASKEAFESGSTLGGKGGGFSRA